MTTLFDFLTVGCLAVVVLAYFYFAANNLGALWHLLISGVAFAAANQLGNAGYVVFAAFLMVVGLGYAGIIIKQNAQ